MDIDLTEASGNGHGTLLSFGLNTVNGESEFDELVSTAGAMLPTTTEMVTRRAYYNDFGVIPRDQSDDPLDLVRMHPKEDIVEGGVQRTWLRAYLRCQLYQLGIMMHEFFDLPYHDALFLTELGESKSVQDSVMASNLSREMTKM